MHIGYKHKQHHNTGDFVEKQVTRLLILEYYYHQRLQILIFRL